MTDTVDWSYGTDTKQGEYKFAGHTYKWASMLFVYKGEGRNQVQVNVMVSFGDTKDEAKDKVKARYKAQQKGESI